MSYDQSNPVPVPRHRVFTLNDGTFVVQWEENRVQNLITGRYAIYTPDKFGAPIDDFELIQLHNAGIVSSYDAELIYLSPSPTIVRQMSRAYYVNTTLVAAKQRTVEQALLEQGLQERYSVWVKSGFVTIRGEKGMPFNNFDEAERVRQQLIKAIPSLSDSVVAYIETNSSA